MLRRVALLTTTALLTLSGGSSVAADTGTQPEARARVAASGRYEANRIHRFALGGGYRDLWQAEIELPVLDLRHEAGGLTPTRRFGGLQTAVLGFVDAEGRAFSFRGTDKDPSAVLHPELRGTVIQTVVQDQMAAQHPGGPLAVGPISEAAGVLTVRERMVVMPDDPLLGEFRAEFAGMVGMFFEFPTAVSERHSGFHGAIDIVDYRELYERLAIGYDDEVDREAFLRARLLDIMLGDFDRHRKQWRWARLPGSDLWQPIPEDRDMAFVRYEGAAPQLAYLYVPILQDYGPEYPFIKGLTLHGWEQDRWLLPALSWPQWKRIASDIQARVTDEVIQAAVAALPPEYQELDGERLRRDLTGRRDRLLEGARSYYEHLSGEVDIQGRAAAESVRVVRAKGGTTRVTIERAADGGRAFDRTFTASETGDLRIYLRGGNDDVKIVGAPNGTTLRVIADDGQKLVDDSAGGGTRIYDENDIVQVIPGPGTNVEDDPYVPPEPDAGFVDVEDVPPRDWGSDTIPIPVFSYERDVGAYFGAGVVHTRYGFRKHPWSSRQSLQAGYATEARRPRVLYDGRFRAENSNLLGTLELGYSGIEILRFYGYGNDTKDDDQNEFFRVRNQQIRAAPGAELTFLDDTLRVGAGPWIQWTNTENGNRLIDEEDPYGTGSFGMIGGVASVRYDTRKTLDVDRGLILPLHENPAAGYPTSGFLVDITAEFSPEVWDTRRTWGAVEGSVATFLTVGDRARATLALRIGGRETFGSTPYFEAAYIGGGRFFRGDATVRGLRADRFAGDSSLFGNADLRLYLARLKIVVPTDIGVFGFGDVGRVFESGDSSKKWHPGAGGGVWIAPLERTNTLSFTVARSEEDTLYYLTLGFLF